jgi:hypothetical protein
MQSIFLDLLDHVTKASSPEDIRAATIVGARALNLFVCLFSVSDQLADTELVQLNSLMIRLPTSGADCADVRDRVVRLIGSVLSDITRFQSRFASPSVATPPVSSQVDISDFDDIDTDLD